MSISLETYSQCHLEAVTALYNRETAAEQHIVPLTPHRFIELVERKSYFDPEGLLVAVGDGSVLGWIHACVAPGSEPAHDPGQAVPRIRMLIFPRERPDVGTRLVTEATRWLKQFGHHEILGMHSKAGYPFYRGIWLGSEPKCPVTMPHVHMALSAAGYKSTLESVFMVGAIDRVPQEPRAAVSIALVDSETEMAHQPMRESWAGFVPMTTCAFVGEEQIGRIVWVIKPYHAERLGAPCVDVWGMGVRETHRRKGIAAALLSRVLLRGYEQGARFASASTQLWNAAAQRTYAKLGLHPHCITVGRTLECKSHE
jgi:GNAT superfamily N-acetyltransferase